VTKLGKNCHTHFSKRVRSYYSGPSSSSSPVTLQFTDGSAAQCDVLIGADGIKSSIRDCMLKDVARGIDVDAAQMKGVHHLDPSKEAEIIRNSAHPVWSGTLAYRAMFPASELAKNVPAHPVLSTPMCVRPRNFLVLPV
jgi:salicylate hydroxylase